MGRQIDRETVLRQLAKVAFCRVNDGVRLVLEEDPRQISRLKLDGVSRVKRGRDGSVEVEFCDKVRALQLLHSLLEEERDGDGLLSFLEETK